MQIKHKSILFDNYECEIMLFFVSVDATIAEEATKEAAHFWK